MTTEQFKKILFEGERIQIVLTLDEEILVYSKADWCITAKSSDYHEIKIVPSRGLNNLGQPTGVPISIYNEILRSRGYQFVNRNRLLKGWVEIYVSPDDPGMRLECHKDLIGGEIVRVFSLKRRKYTKQVSDAAELKNYLHRRKHNVALQMYIEGMRGKSEKLNRRTLGVQNF